MTYKGYNPTAMPAETPVSIQVPEITSPDADGEKPKARPGA